MTPAQEGPRFSLRLKFSFLSVLALIQILLVALSVLFTMVIVDSLKTRDREKAAAVAKYVEGRLSHVASRAALAAAVVAESHRVGEALAAADRPLLLERCQGIWKQLQAFGIKQFNFARPTPAGMVEFLRIHHSEVYGDVAARATMLKCHEERRLVSGLEQGKAGWAFRSVAPVNHQGRYLGCVELGLPFGEAQLAEFNENFPGLWSLVNLQRGVAALTADRVVLASLNQDLERAVTESLAVPPDVLNSVRAGRAAERYQPKTEQVSLYIPIRDFKGDVALYLRHDYRTDYYQQLRRMLAISIFICALGLALSGFIILALYREITGPISGLVAETEKIRRFDLDGKVDVAARLREIQTMVSAVANMKAGLLAFQKYVPAQLVRQLMDSGEEVHLSGQRREVTIFFSDIADFTTISESLRPAELTGQLCEYLSAVTGIIMSEGGIVDKYIGDAVMAFWGAPQDLRDHAARACAAAVKVKRRVDELNNAWAAAGRPQFKTRLGINTGEVIVGNMGSEQRLNYTVVGDAVNLASRLEGLNKSYGTGIIISQETYERCKDAVEARMLDFVVVKGRTESTVVYELLAVKGDISTTDKEYYRRFTEAVALYRLRRFDEAGRQFAALLEKRPADQPARMFSARCERFKACPPPDDWDGLDVPRRRHSDLPKAS